MKLAIVYLLFSFCATLTATGIRGSAERIYMQEEIFTDPAKDGGIATGCVGSRTGLRGQKQRCTLRELCEYIWAPTGDYNTKPDPSKMLWPTWNDARADKVWSEWGEGDRTVAEVIAQVVEDADEKDRKGKKGVYYNGFWDTSKVLPGFSDKPSEYYRAARELGDWQVAARKAIEKQLEGNALTAEQKKRFQNWNMESERALKLVLGLRSMNLNEFVIKQMRRANYFGQPIARTPMTGYEEFEKMKGAMQPDRGGTIVTYEFDYPGGRDKVIQDYDAAMSKILKTPDNKAHRKAVTNWAHSYNRVRAAPVLPPEILLLLATRLRPRDQISLLQFANRDKEGNTILHLLAQANTAPDAPAAPGANIPFFPSILDSSQGDVLHPRNRKGHTPLMEAAFAGNIPFMQRLLEKDPGGLNMKNRYGVTALWCAVFGESAAATALLLEQPSVEVNPQMTEGRGRDAYQTTPFTHALRHGRGRYDVISLFVKHPETDLTFPDSFGVTAIHLAIGEDREDLVRDLLECGRLDVNASCRFTGETALHTAAVHGNAGLVKLLLAQSGIDINRPTRTGATPLMQTARPRCMELLLAHPGIEVDRVDDFGWSALGWAAYYGRLECAQVLLRHGARPDLVDLDGFTPRDRAEQAKKWEMVKLLEGALGQE
ncbi:ankyrin repeat domain-containing protein [Aspergillus lucknowensis]|uniref:Ankyrin repeat-containing domain protein n=1 Tax=Aspergillus lucknowensis TaxID=176173 RepID=A0ABR4LBL9_9EURO